MTEKYSLQHNPTCSAAKKKKEEEEEVIWKTCWNKNGRQR